MIIESSAALLQFIPSLLTMMSFQWMRPVRITPVLMINNSYLQLKINVIAQIMRSIFRGMFGNDCVEKPSVPLLIA